MASRAFNQLAFYFPGMSVACRYIHIHIHVYMKGFAGVMFSLLRFYSKQAKGRISRQEENVSVVESSKIFG